MNGLRLRRSVSKWMALLWVGGALLVGTMTSGWAQTSLMAAEPVVLTDINLASQAELEMVSGIGPDLSGHLLVLRQQRAFRDWADVIARVKGVGKVRAQRLSQEGLRVQGEPYPALNAKTPAPRRGEPSRQPAPAPSTPG